MDWISVKDRLPDAHDNVICTHAKDKWVSAGWYDCKNNEWYDVRDCYCTIEVTHWQPLPQPPKED